MAGSASNWFKPGGGSLKGRAVYLSVAQRQALAPTGTAPLSRAQVMARLVSDHRETLRAANAERPAAAAGSAATNWPKRGKGWEAMDADERLSWVQTSVRMSRNRPEGTVAGIRGQGDAFFVSMRDPKTPGTTRVYRVDDPWASYPTFTLARRLRGGQVDSAPMGPTPARPASSTRPGRAYAGGTQRQAMTTALKGQYKNVLVTAKQARVGQPTASKTQLPTAQEIAQARAAVRGAVQTHFGNVPLAFEVDAAPGKLTVTAKWGG